MGVPENPGARGVGGAGARGAFLLAVALVLGIVLLQKFDDKSAGGGAGADTTPKAKTSTTVAVKTSLIPTTTARPVRPPEQVKVLVSNGAGVDGFATKVKTFVEGFKYNALGAVNGTRTVEATLVEYAPDFEPEARVLATHLGLPASSVRPLEDSPPIAGDLRGADVLVVAGADIKFPGETATTSTTVRR